MKREKELLCIGLKGNSRVFVWSHEALHGVAQDQIAKTNTSARHPIPPLLLGYRIDNNNSAQRTL